MKKFIGILILVSLVRCTSTEQKKASLVETAAAPKAAPTSQICVLTYCRDSVWLPTNSMPLVAYVTSTDTIKTRGWSYTSGPSVITVQAGKDSVPITGLIAGQYVFTYNVTNSKGMAGVGRDTVTVIPLSMTIGVILYPSGKKDTVKPFTNMTIYYSNGSNKVVTP